MLGWLVMVWRRYSARSTKRLGLLHWHDDYFGDVCGLHVICGLRAVIATDFIQALIIIASVVVAIG